MPRADRGTEGRVPVWSCSARSVVGYYTDHELVVSRIDREAGGLRLLRARAVVMATGCIEQPAVFRNNDLPGVLLGSAAQRLLYRHGIAPARRVVVLGANDEAVALRTGSGLAGVAGYGPARFRKTRHSIPPLCR